MTPSVEDKITLRSVEIDESGLLTVVYSKDFPDCLDLVDPDEGVTHSDPTFFCGEGSMVEETHTLDKFSFATNQVKLCRDDDDGQCSELVPIAAPAQRLVVYLHCELARDLAERLELPFDCAAPSSELTGEIGSRLSLYVRDLQTVFSKRTVRRFAFDPASDVFLTETQPHSGSCCGNPQPTPFGHELWIWAQLSDHSSGETYGGTMSYDHSGAGVADGLRWDQLHDPAQLQDHSASLQQYWRQIDHITHEFAHALGAGLGEYYSLGIVQDTTGMEPVVNVSKREDDLYWSRNADYFSDPLMHNIWDNPLAGSPSTYDDLLAGVDFAPVTAAVLNRAARFALAETVHDLETSRVRVVDRNGEPIAGARVYAWNVWTSSPYTSELRLAGAVTGSDGMVDFPWECCVGACSSCFNNRDHMKLIKVFADDHSPGVRLFSVYDAQESKLVHRRPDLVVDVRLAALRGDADVFTASYASPSSRPR